MSKIINHLYGGKVDVVFESTQHRYYYDGKAVKGVTGILGVIDKPFLVGWAARMACEKMEELFLPNTAYDEIEIKQKLEQAKFNHHFKKTSAADIGTLVHHTIEAIIAGEEPEELEDREAQKAVDRFMKWAKDNEVKFLLSEQMVYSLKHNYCGTLDFACRIGGKLMIGDIKTSNAIHKVEMGGQMSAYRMARQEEFPKENYEGMILVRVGKKDGEFEPWEVPKEDFPIYDQIFLDALNLTNSIAKVEENFATRPQ